MCKVWVLSLAPAATSWAAVSASQKIDRSRAKVVVLNPKKKTEANAADMLVGEIDKGTRIELNVVSKMPSPHEVAVVIGTAREFGDKSYRPLASLNMILRLADITLFREGVAERSEQISERCRRENR